MEDETEGEIEIGLFWKINSKQTDKRENGVVIYSQCYIVVVCRFVCLFVCFVCTFVSLLYFTHKRS